MGSRGQAVSADGRPGVLHLALRSWDRQYLIASQETSFPGNFELLSGLSLEQDESRIGRGTLLTSPRSPMKPKLYYHVLLFIGKCVCAGMAMGLSLQTSRAELGESKSAIAIRFGK